MTTRRIGISSMSIDSGLSDNGRIVPSRWVQRALNAAGFHLDVDGSAGPLTLSALRTLAARWGQPRPLVFPDHLWVVISKAYEDRLAALTYDTADTAPAITDPPPPPPPPPVATAVPTDTTQPITDQQVSPAGPRRNGTDVPAPQRSSVLPLVLAVGGLAAIGAYLLNRSGGSGVSGLGSTPCDEKDERAQRWRVLMYEYANVPESEWPRIDREKAAAKAAYEEASDDCWRLFDQEVQSKRAKKRKV